jgi:hypothetical protein
MAAAREKMRRRCETERNRGGEIRPNFLKYSTPGVASFQQIPQPNKKMKHRSPSSGGHSKTKHPLRFQFVFRSLQTIGFLIAMFSSAERHTLV